MKRLVLWAVSLYPRSWRERYGDEMRAMLAESPASLRTLANILSHVGRVHLRNGSHMDVNLKSMSAHPRRLALAGFVILLPTAVLTSVGVLKYMIGFAAPFDAIEPALTPFVTSPVGETALIVAPYLAFALALFPVGRVRLGWRDGAVAADVQLRAPVLNLTVAAISALLIVFMAAYYLVENV